MSWFNSLLPNLFSSPKEAPYKKQSNSEIPEKTPEPSSEPGRIVNKKIPLETLKKLAPVRHLEDAVIEKLPQKCLFFNAQSQVFTFGQQTDSVYYLLKGTISIHPNSDNSYQISSDSVRANLPLNSSNIFSASAVAVSDITVLAISVELNTLWNIKSQNDIDCVELIDIELPEQLNNNRFFTSFCQAYKQNKLYLPSLPAIAFKLKEAMQHNNIGIHEAVEIIQIDPPIVTKLIQIANSSLYAPTSTINNCLDAVNRLGLEATRNLVMGISLKQLFNCKDKQLMHYMQQLWKQSLYISSLSFVLAQESGTVNPEDALVAGLVSDIGIIPLLNFAEQYPGLSELENSIPCLKAPVGALMLHTLGFSKELSDIPHLSENWLYDSGGKLNLTDIVILAKLHSHFGSKKAKNLPYINSIPAYAKLKEGKLNPDFSLKILYKAQNRINTAMNLLR